MKKLEVLSPVGDVKSFYTAIKSGADAVYMGLPKFNARLRAENINLENLPTLINYAHLKGVKVYITLNTLLSNKEISEAITLVEECMRAGVDAFIVQDYGLIYTLRSVFPEINLHGSTQLGVHNIRGAKIAKSLGLSRVVLSREVTLRDIKEISENVDIELEVFVQGAMCVCFSGNCYISSIKHNASGNRGECKQLCRLPYTLSNSKSSKSGYMLSPRDNCMIDYMRDLIDVGVISFKIEGRLRHSGYVAVATSSYRQAIDSIINNESYNTQSLKNNLKKVFSRGEYISGYFDSNNIINTKENNHLGECIGKVIKSTKFKDIYKITLCVNKPLQQGDGLKFVTPNNTITMGVGNIEQNGKYIDIFGKNYIESDTKVYLSLDSQFENSVPDYSRRNSVRMEMSVQENSPISLKISCGKYCVCEMGDVPEKAQSKALDKSTIINQLSKLDKDIFEIEDIQINLDENLFLPLSKLNDIRRKTIEKLTSKILKVNELKKEDSPIILSRKTSFESLAIIDEKYNFSSNEANALILSPSVYSKELIENFRKKYAERYSSPLFINLPIIAMTDDLRVIDEIVEYFKDKNCIFVANNIYALDYANMGARIFAGFGLNISNDYSASILTTLGCEEVFSSFEKWSPTLKDSYKFTQGYLPLMTFAHCPNKTLKNNDCSSCSHVGDLTLTSNNSRYKVRRYKICNCYFDLVDDRLTSSDFSNRVIDLRN